MNFDILPQLLWNGFVSGSLYALLAIGLALIYGVLRFVNFAYGQTAMAGGYLFLLYKVIFGWPIIPSFILAIFSMMLIGLAIEYLTFLPVKDSPILIPLIISIGVNLIIKNLILIIAGPKVWSFVPKIETHRFFNDKIIFTDVHVWILILTAACFLMLYIFLKKTKIGKAVRAVSDSKEIASILGINAKLIITAVFLISTALAAVAGIMVGFDQNLNSNIGSFLNIKAFAAVILGGIGSLPGAILGGFFIGFAENLLVGVSIAHFYLPSGYKDAIAFFALLLILYLKPTGLLGGRQSDAVRK